MVSKVILMTTIQLPGGEWQQHRQSENFISVMTEILLTFGYYEVVRTSLLMSLHKKHNL